MQQTKENKLAVFDKIFGMVSFYAKRSERSEKMHFYIFAIKTEEEVIEICKKYGIVELRDCQEKTIWSV